MVAPSKRFKFLATLMGKKDAVYEENSLHTRRLSGY